MLVENDELFVSAGCGQIPGDHGTAGRSGSDEVLVNAAPRHVSTAHVESLLLPRTFVCVLVGCRLLHSGNRGNQSNTYTRSSSTHTQPIYLFRYKSSFLPFLTSVSPRHTRARQSLGQIGGFSWLIKQCPL